MKEEDVELLLKDTALTPAPKRAPSGGARPSRRNWTGWVSALAAAGLLLALLGVLLTKGRLPSTEPEPIEATGSPVTLDWSLDRIKIDGGLRWRLHRVAILPCTREILAREGFFPGDRSVFLENRGDAYLLACRLTVTKRAPDGTWKRLPGSIGGGVEVFHEGRKLPQTKPGMRGYSFARDGVIVSYSRIEPFRTAATSPTLDLILNVPDRSATEGYRPIRFDGLTPSDVRTRKALAFDWSPGRVYSDDRIQATLKRFAVLPCTPEHLRNEGVSEKDIPKWIGSDPDAHFWVLRFQIHVDGVEIGGLGSDDGVVHGEARVLHEWQQLAKTNPWLVRSTHHSNHVVNVTRIHPPLLTRESVRFDVTYELTLDDQKKRTIRFKNLEIPASALKP